MGKQKLTPEEQLLKLIEKDNESEPAEVKRGRRGFFSFNRLRNSRIFSGKGIRQRLIKLKLSLREPNIKIANKAFLSLSVVLLIYSIISLIFSRFDMKKVYTNLRPMEKKQFTQKTIIKDRPFLHYLEMARRRNIFSPIELKEEEDPAIKEKELQEITKSLRLVGISWEEEPMAMIEKKGENKTYFLKKGDSIGQFKINNILEGGVILDYNGKLVELM